MRVPRPIHPRTVTLARCATPCEKSTLALAKTPLQKHFGKPVSREHTDLRRGADRWRIPGRHRTFPGVEPWPLRVGPGPYRWPMGQRPERLGTRIALPGLHRGTTRGHRSGTAGVLLARLAAHRRRILLVAVAPRDSDTCATIGLAACAGDRPGGAVRSGPRAPLSHHSRPADTGRILSHRQRRSALRR